MKKRKQCKRCNGSGWIRNPKYSEGEYEGVIICFGLPEDYGLICPDCKGLGTRGRHRKKIASACGTEND